MWLAGRLSALATETFPQAIGELTPADKATRAVVYSGFRDVIDSFHE
ncbi:MAG: hypothetical protein ACLP4R_29855 [Solirubrobacteraceae bacterium]